MFENLTEKLQRAFKTLRGQGTLNEENIQEALREIRVAMLEAGERPAREPGFSFVIARLVLDYRAQRRMLVELDMQGVTRRSEPATLAAEKEA